jgi:hypothetical protein
VASPASRWRPVRNKCVHRATHGAVGLMIRAGRLEQRAPWGLLTNMTAAVCRARLPTLFESHSPPPPTICTPEPPPLHVRLCLCLPVSRSPRGGGGRPGWAVAPLPGWTCGTTTFPARPPSSFNTGPSPAILHPLQHMAMQPSIQWTLNTPMHVVLCRAGPPGVVDVRESVWGCKARLMNNVHWDACSWCWRWRWCSRPPHKPCPSPTVGPSTWAMGACRTCQT